MFECICYNNPYDTAFDPTGRYLGSPSIVELPKGDLIASNDMFLESYHNPYEVDFRSVPSYERCVTHLYKSTDGGKNGEYFSKINCSVFGKLLKDKLYVRGLSSNPDAVLTDPFNVDENKHKKPTIQQTMEAMMFCSEDMGISFGEPCNYNKRKVWRRISQCCRC